ncbi:MAG TPA: sigma-70 family RNA polymerase sigma factor [Myxococcaceae bacterium]|nr:sigma-70 family RNA polymerase sigma factor [Myxococcaceae bacterium]
MNAGQRLSVIAGGETQQGAPDEALWKAALSGDDRAFGELVARHQALVLKLVRRYARTPEDARDLAQQVFLRAVDGWSRTFLRFQRKEIPFRAWLIRVAVNLGKNHARQLARWALEPLPEVEPPAPGPLAVEVLEAAERSRMARAMALQLPKRQREVLTLRIDAGLSFEEIAVTLGITANNAKVHYHHAVKKLAAKVAQER